MAEFRTDIKEVIRKIALNSVYPTTHVWMNDVTYVKNNYTDFRNISNSLNVRFFNLELPDSQRPAGKLEEKVINWEENLILSLNNKNKMDDEKIAKMDDKEKAIIMTKKKLRWKMKKRLCWMKKKRQ